MTGERTTISGGATSTRATLDWIDRPSYAFADGLAAIEEEPVPLKQLSTLPYRGRHLQEVKLVKAALLNELFSLVADRRGTPVRDVVHSITGGKDMGIDRGADDELILWLWKPSDAEPTTKDVRDLLIRFLRLKGYGPKVIARVWDISERHVNRILKDKTGRFSCATDSEVRAYLGLDPV